MRTVRCPDCGERALWFDESSGWAKCAPCDRTFQPGSADAPPPPKRDLAAGPFRTPGAAAKQEEEPPAEPDPEPPWPDASDRPPLPPRPRTIEVRELLGGARQVVIRRRLDLVALVTGLAIFWVLGVFPTWAALTGTLRFESGAVAPPVFALPFVLLTLVGAWIVVRSLGRARIETHLVLRARGISIVDARASEIARPTRLDVQLAIRSAGRAHRCHLVAHPAAGPRAFVATLLTVEETDYLAALLADSYAIARPAPVGTTARSPSD